MVRTIHFLTTGIMLALLILVCACSPAKQQPTKTDDSKAVAGKDDSKTDGDSKAVAGKNDSKADEKQDVAKAHHDPDNPPIDCPLRKQGIDPSHLKPFEDVEKYIAFLEREDRKLWQKPDEVIKTLGLKGDETIVDIGAGSGYFSFRFSKALPSGQVIAADVEPEMIRHIHHKAMMEGIDNIQAMIIDAEKPEIPEGADIIFICDVMHHIQDPEAWLKLIHRATRAETRVVIIEFKEGKLPEGPPESLKISKQKLKDLFGKAGFVPATPVWDYKDVLPYQELLIFKHADPKAK